MGERSGIGVFLLGCFPPRTEGRDSEIARTGIGNRGVFAWVFPPRTEKRRESEFPRTRGCRESEFPRTRRGRDREIAPTKRKNYACWTED